MNTIPFLSVIIPVHQVEPYVGRCLKSVLAQTYAPTRIECIIVDDCGTDNSMGVVANILESYQGLITVRIISHVTNQGLSVARNTGLKDARGDYVFFLDSDDWIEPFCLECLVNALGEHPDAEVVVGNAYYVKGQRHWVSEKDVPKGMIGNWQLQELFFQFLVPDTVWNTLYRRDLLEQYKMSFFPGICHEDQLWSFQLYQKVEKYLFVPKVTLHYEDNPQSTVNSFSKDYNPSVAHMVIVLEQMLSDFSFRHYVSNTLYIQEYLMRYLDIARKENVKPELRKQMSNIRNKLFIRDLSNFRIVLVIFELQLFAPFSWIVSNWAGYRRHYSFFTGVVRRIAELFSPLHHDIKTS